MRILLVASRPSDATSVESSLLDAGHTVTTCHDGAGGPCRGIDDPHTCPLESSVDVAVVARSASGESSPLTMGAVCATQHRVGVVEVDPVDPATDRLYEMADAAEKAICDQYADTVRTLVRQALPPGTATVVDVARHDLDVHVSVLLDRRVDPLTTAAVADRARAAVRRHDRFARVIDVAVVQGAC